jgi:hypothetical protein
MSMPQEISMTNQLLVSPDAPANPVHVQREPAHRPVSVMGPANRARVDIMGVPNRDDPFYIMGGPDRGPRVDVMGGPDQPPRVDIMGASDPGLVDSLFTGTRGRRHATVPRTRHTVRPSHVGSVAPAPYATYAD